MDWLIDDEEEVIETKSNGNWNVLIVDDEQDVHTITKLALNNFSFEGNKLSFLSAYNYAEAVSLFTEHDDIAMAFVDVVMDTEDAGFKVINNVRYNLQNHYTRLILRTGQPGLMNENEVMPQFDIDGYLKKTDATKQRIENIIYASLRSYRDVCRLQKYKLGLEKLDQDTAKIDDLSQCQEYINNTLASLCELLELNQVTVFIQKVREDVNDLTFVYENSEENNSEECQTDAIVARVLQEKSSVLEAKYKALYNHSYDNIESVCIVCQEEELEASDQRLLLIFLENISNLFYRVTKSAV